VGRLRLVTLLVVGLVVALPDVGLAAERIRPRASELVSSSVVVGPVSVNVALDRPEGRLYPPSSARWQAAELRAGGPIAWSRVDPSTPRLLVVDRRIGPSVGVGTAPLPRLEVEPTPCARGAGTVHPRSVIGLVHPDHLRLLGPEDQVLTAEDFADRSGAGWRRPLQVVRERDQHRLTLEELALVLGAEDELARLRLHEESVRWHLRTGTPRMGTGVAMMILSGVLVPIGFVWSGMWMLEGPCGMDPEGTCVIPPIIHAGRFMFALGWATFGSGTGLLVWGHQTRDRARRRAAAIEEGSASLLAPPPRVLEAIDRHNRRLARRPAAAAQDDEQLDEAP
jgi:hypothetical protein